ncbi:cysteine desulfurase [Microbacterium bovistercoris]|uniref:Cysteine desulfurase n=1 Tax=Microbacterium bovistercoris TaxID=2293570 RepID=A0A371NYI9_9MICO|nr:cysteine desulfurase family protein [Microbacterium bovistercoris]REJ07664.1 cysteine desulfurase [Microbacterium bovistercoris]
MLYADHAATSPVRPEVLQAMAPYLGGVFGNPSSHHTIGEAASRALADARARMAAVLGMRAGDIVFTSGGTEANNLAVKGIVLASGRRHLITTPIEHESILESAAYLRRFHGVEVTLLPVSATGLVDPDAVSAAVRPDTALVSIGHANNEIGTVQDIAEIATRLADGGADGGRRTTHGDGTRRLQNRPPSARTVPLHLDAVQSAGWLDLAGLGADAISIAGHKLGAPKGIGALAVRGRVPVEPLLHGGGQEHGRRSGTENVAAAVGLAVALELAEAERVASADLVRRRTATFIEAVLRLVPSAALTGDDDHRLPAVASFTFGGVSGESVLLELERRGVVSSSGSACAAGSDKPSHVLVACGIDPVVAQTSVRFTFGRAPLENPESLAGLVADSVAAVSGG